MVKVSSDSCEAAVDCLLFACSQHHISTLDILTSDNWMMRIKNGPFTREEASASVGGELHAGLKISEQKCSCYEQLIRH